MRRGEIRNQRYGVAGARASKPGARGEPVTPLLRQRVDLEDLDSLSWVSRCSVSRRR
jgi:hypothetical protein